MSQPKLLGTIVHLQLARRRLRSTDEVRVYSPENLMSPAEFVLTRSGIIGATDEGWLLDRHHAEHPDNLTPNPLRALSIGFTSHYRAIADRFGSADTGVAGENIIVDSAEIVTLDMIEGGLEIRADGRSLDLGTPAIAEPCIPFTRFMMGGDPSPEEVEPNREFLRKGMRGFVVGLSGLEGPTPINIGDQVWAR